MVVSHKYLGLVFLLISSLAQSSYIPPVTHSVNLVSSDHSYNPATSNSSPYECYTQPSNGQPQWQPIEIGDCNSLVSSILLQADSENHEPNRNVAAITIPRTYAFGTCAVAWKNTSEGSDGLDMVTMSRQLALLVATCSDQQPIFLGGSSLMSQNAHSYVEVSRRQNGSQNTGYQFQSAVSTAPVHCWQWKPSRIPQRVRFQEPDCNANIVQILADTDVMQLIRSTPATIPTRPFWQRTHNGCSIKLYAQGICVEYYQLVNALQGTARILANCRSQPPDPQGELGGLTELHSDSCINVVLEGTETPSDEPVPTGLLRRGRPAKVVRLTPTTNLDSRIPHIRCQETNPTRVPPSSLPFVERDCKDLIGRIYNSPDALVLRAWNTNEEVSGASRTCRIYMGKRPSAGSGVEYFSTGDVAYIAELIISECGHYGPLNYGGSRSITEESAFDVMVMGIVPRFDGLVPLQSSTENSSIISPLSSRISRRNSSADTAPSSITAQNSDLDRKCFATDPGTHADLRPYHEPHCTTLMQRMRHHATADVPRRFTPGDPLLNWTFRTCRITFGTKPVRGSGTEFFSLADISYTAGVIVRTCRDCWPPDIGGQSDARSDSAFRVVVWGNRIGAQLSDSLWDRLSGSLASS